MAGLLPAVSLLRSFSLDAFSLLQASQVNKVGSCEGDIYTWTVPELRKVSKLNAFKCSVDLLHCSSDKKWTFASGTHDHILPKQAVLSVAHVDWAHENSELREGAAQANSLVASFLLPVHMEGPIGMGVSDGNRIVSQRGPHLLLFTVDGLLLQRFEHHERIIGKLRVDSLHAHTTSMDTLQVYAWEEGGHYSYLKSCHWNTQRVMKHRAGKPCIVTLKFP
ncbi:LOW QUALITY PROTEIN: F-box/WD repeat-containing protein 12 [Hippopotamus amphibius kiboko]|uniref:LOW QUALITY PROTEIN: F-box/WD repeat-containing protein 12 n=1 Tax=Hippopotamus amphibius kiboko TaxID=575201 RepID=UPI00259343A9|nr:LOW QUALITY PROTEIN: F-box/WD repeat-containing protein 12 [Hippopotamus amphibius kiboko]